MRSWSSSAIVLPSSSEKYAWSSWLHGQDIMTKTPSNRQGCTVTQHKALKRNIVCSPHVSSQLRLIVGDFLFLFDSIGCVLFHALHLEVLNSFTYNPWRVISRGPFLFWNMVMCHFDGWHLGMRIWQASWMCGICRISLIRHGKKNLEPLGCQVRKKICLIHWCVT